MDTPVFDVVHMFSERGISAVPIVDEEGIVVNLYETVDVIVSTFQLEHVETCLMIACANRHSSDWEHTKPWISQYPKLSLNVRAISLAWSSALPRIRLAHSCS